MDAVFHAASAGLLASALKERRPHQIVLAAAIGTLPDVAWGAHHLSESWLCEYAVCHSLLYCSLVAGVIAAFNWRIALGLPLHVLVDLPLHKQSPLFRMLQREGFDWYVGHGRAVAAALWVALILLTAVRVMMATRRWCAAKRLQTPDR